MGVNWLYQASFHTPSLFNRAPHVVLPQLSTSCPAIAGIWGDSRTWLISSYLEGYPAPAEVQLEEFGAMRALESQGFEACSSSSSSRRDLGQHRNWVGFSVSPNAHILF